MQRSPMAEDPARSGRDAPGHGQRGLAVKRAALLSLGVLALVFLVALGSSRSLGHIGGPGDLSHAQEVTGSVIVVLIAVLVALGTLYVIWQLLREYADEDHDQGERLPTWRRLLAQLIAILTMAAVVFVLALVSKGRARSRPQPSGQRQSGTVPHAKGRSASEQTAASLAPWIIGGVLVVIVLLMIAVLILRRRRYGDLESELPGDELGVRRSELREAIEDSLEEIEREPDSRKAVIRAYAGMERTLAERGLGRRRHEAPVEYLTRAFAAIQMSKGAGERLTRLFERARFSEHEIGLETKREAIAALTEVRDELREASQ